MTIRAFAAAGLLSLLSGSLFSQSTSATPTTFQVADVQVSAPIRFPFFPGGTLTGDRYIMKNATMVDLIAAAYNVDVSNVQGGPSWLERDRFDITGKIPAAAMPTPRKDTINLMIQAVLADRFKLALHTGSKPMPAYVLTVAKGATKIKPAEDESAPDHCQFTGKPPAPGQPFFLSFTCKNTSMDSFATQVHQWAGGYLTNPVVDQTNLKGGYDFDLRFTNSGDLAKAGADGISIFDAVEKQLGLKLELLTAPRPVMIVDSVNEKPSSNPSDLEKIMPPLPPREFEVATIKPSKPDATGFGGSGITADRVDVQNIPMRFLISFAWDLNPNDKEVPVNAPKWLDDDKFDILAKVSSSPLSKAAQPSNDELRLMVRDLLTERFKLKTHLEDRTMSAYKLVAVNPKMKKADPASRTVCKEGPGPDGKDPRVANPILGRLMYCQNMTMNQFADELQRIAGGYIYGDVLNATGLEGSWDFTLSFSTAGQLGTGADPAAAGAPSTPNGALSLFDAINKQLGLRLEKDKRPVSVLVIDHIEEKPTEN